MKYLSAVLGLCLFFIFGWANEMQANHKLETVVTPAPTKVITATFKVSGNCGMCKTTIEKSLKGVKGIKAATWDLKTKTITVVYNSKLITLEDIHQKIAAVGYDTEKVKAKDEVYKGLHGCCQYDRS
jgi:periplasmic mercuric ion binding protein